MEIRLRITGGLAGHNFVQSFIVDESSIPIERFREMERALSKCAQAPAEATPPFPNALQYEFEFGPQEARASLQFHDANLPEQIRSVVTSIQQQAQKESHAKAKGSEGEDKQEGE